MRQSAVGLGKLRDALQLFNLWNVGVVTVKRKSMAKCLMVTSAISAATASKPFPRALTRSTTTGISDHNRLTKCCKLIVKAQGKRGISRITGLADNTVVSIIRASSAKALLVHNDQVKAVATEEVSGDEMWSFGQKNRSNVGPKSWS